MENTNDSGAGSLRSCVDNAADGSLITFDASLDGQTINLTTSEITMDTDMTVSAEGQSITVSANAITKGFVIDPGKTVTLDNLTIRAGTGTDGRAIENNGNLILKDVELIENTGLPVGGSLFWNKGSSTFQGSNKIE